MSSRPKRSVKQLVIDEEYDEILQDMRQEADKYGRVVSVILPRTKKLNEPTSGLGSVFIEYSNVNEARIARRVS